MTPVSKIRLLKASDLPAIDLIYRQAIEAKISTAHTEPPGEKEWQDWYLEHTPGEYPVYILEENNELTAWISLSPYRKGRNALRSVAEISYYVHKSFHRRGHASRLMEHAIREAPLFGFKSLIAIIMEPNRASVGLLAKFGFQLWGDMPGILEVEGKSYNHQYYGLHLSAQK